jgi:hypothetical protein
LSRHAPTPPGHARLRGGTYADDGQNNGTAEGGTPNGKGIWTFSKLGVLITGANAEWCAHAPTMQTVTVRSATIDLPFLACRRSASIQGDPAIKLEEYRASAPFTVDATTIAGATSPQLALPALQDCN